MFKNFIETLKEIWHRFSIKNNRTDRDSTTKIDPQVNEKPDATTDEEVAEDSTTSDESQSQEDTGTESDSQTDSVAPGKEKSDDQTSTEQSETQEVEKQPTDTDKPQGQEDTGDDSDSQTDFVAPDEEKADEQTSTGQPETQETEEHSTPSDEPQNQEDTGDDSDSQTDSAAPGEDELDNKAIETESQPDFAGAHTPAKKDKTGNAGRTKEPWNIGGRRGFGSNVPEDSTDHMAERNFKPELVCQKNSWQWEILLTVPEEHPPVKVQQNGVSLSVSNGGYRLNDFSEDLTIVYEDCIEKVELYKDESPLIFKLRKRWRGDGRRVRGISRGYFIVFALNEWERTGDPPITEEACSDGKFSAHYFYSDGSTTDDGFEGYELPSNREAFSLKGSSIYDDSEQGLLFISNPPDLEITESVAESVSWVRIGAEGGGCWRGENFRSAEQHTVNNALNGRQGWFYVRIYDQDVKLMDSDHFRYSQPLKEIRVDDTVYSDDMLLVPSTDKDTNGYTETIIQFIDTEGNNIFPEQKGNNSHTSICNDGAVIVAPHPDGDLTEWKVGSVDTVITLPRIWWRIMETEDEWRATPIVMSREEFRENADAVVQISLPSNLDEIQVGFDCDLQRAYSATADDENENKREVELPIRDFVDYEEIENPSSKDTHLKIQCNGKVLPIIRVSADRLPPLTKPLVNDPQVKKPAGGLRRGKGFSYGELRNANITVDEAKDLGIKTDLRRQTVHQVNIDKLVETKGEKDARSE